MKIGLPGIVFLIFLCCKIFGVMPIAAWSWWLVFSPLWISAILIVVLVAIKVWAED